MHEEKPLYTWVPPAARSNPAAVEWWSEDPIKRALKHIHADRDTLRLDMAALLLSFTPDQLARAISERMDLTPFIERYARLDHPALRKVAEGIMYNNGRTLLLLLRGARNEGPTQILQDVAAQDPVKARILSTPQGWDWFNAAAWKLARWVYDFAHLEGDFWYDPPPGVAALRNLDIPLPKPETPPGDGQSQEGGHS
jgi:hypothetical protein